MAMKQLAREHALPAKHSRSRLATCSVSRPAGAKRPRRCALSVFAAQSQQPECLHKVVLEAREATEEYFTPFGQLISATDDGKLFDDQDAQLVLDRGPSPPRFYIMKLPRRGLQFDRITFHMNVTQCLGSVNSEPWYLVVAEPTGTVDRPPTPADLHAFRVPHGSFVKLKEATWHAGPLFDAAVSMSFFNLELADTNVVDHNTHDYTLTNEVFEVREAGKRVRWWTDTLRELDE